MSGGCHILSRINGNRNDYVVGLTREDVVQKDERRRNKCSQGRSIMGERRKKYGSFSIGMTVIG